MKPFKQPYAIGEIILTGTPGTILEAKETVGGKPPIAGFDVHRTLAREVHSPEAARAFVARFGFLEGKQTVEATKLIEFAKKVRHICSRIDAIRETHKIEGWKRLRGESKDSAKRSLRYLETELLCRAFNDFSAEVKASFPILLEPREKWAIGAPLAPVLRNGEDRASFSFEPTTLRAWIFYCIAQEVFGNVFHFRCKNPECQKEHTIRVKLGHPPEFCPPPAKSKTNACKNRYNFLKQTKRLQKKG